MKKLTSTAFVLLSCLAGTALVAGGCGTAKLSSGFKEETDAATQRTDRNDTPDASTPDAEPPPVFSENDAGLEGGTFSWLDAGCATATAETHKDPVYLLFVVDGSGSMGSENKWEAQVQALDAIFDDFKAQNDTELGVGFILFADEADPTNGSGPYPSSKDVFIAHVDQAQHKALRDRIDLSDSSGGTPTYAALSGGYQLLENLVAPPPLPKNGRKVLVLITDGVPNGGDTEKQQCIKAAEDKLKLTGPGGPITTFAVGVGAFPTSSTGSYDPKFMGQLAFAGGASPQGCNPNETSNANKLCHFQITPNGKPVNQIAQEFVDAINQIRGAVTTCEYTLELGSQGKVDPEKVNVIFTDRNGKVHIFLQDEAEGWTYDDPSAPKKVVLHGSSCTQVREDARGKVQVILGCATHTN